VAKKNTNAKVVYEKAYLLNLSSKIQTASLPTFAPNIKNTIFGILEKNCRHIIPHAFIRQPVQPGISVSAM
jgi:hypothetical protein